MTFSYGLKRNSLATKILKINAVIQMCQGGYFQKGANLALLSVSFGTSQELAQSRG